jgi:C3HC4-type zinc finger (RING finger) protein
MQMMCHLEDIYNCAICLEPMKTAVFLNPCGHEFDEACVRGVLETSNKKCPVCQVDVYSFQPAYTTRQAIAKLQQIMPNSSVVIHVRSLSGHHITLNMERNCKVAKLLPLFSKSLGFSSPKNIKLTANGQTLSPFKYLYEVIPNDKSEYTFYASEYLGHWTTQAKDHRLIFETALAEVGNEVGKSSDLRERFMNLYEEALSKALNEV